MRVERRVQRSRTPALAALLAAAVAAALILTAAGSAEAHLLYIQAARAKTLSVAKRVHADSYDAVKCRRDSTHLVRCLYVVRFKKRGITCGNYVWSFYLTHRDRSIHIRLGPDGPACVDQEGRRVLVPRGMTR